MVFGLRLTGGRDVVVKARADDGRAGPCVAAQAWLAGSPQSRSYHRSAAAPGTWRPSPPEA